MNNLVIINGEQFPRKEPMETYVDCKSKDSAKTDSIGWGIATIFLGPIALILEIYTLRKGWEWFITPEWNIAVPSFWIGDGINIDVGTVYLQTNCDAKESINVRFYSFQYDHGCDSVRYTLGSSLHCVP